MFICYVKAPLPTPKPVKVYQGKQIFNVYPVPAAFDIETTNDEGTKAAYMYHWQFAIGEAVYAGRTWDDFFLFLDYLNQGAYYKDGIVYVFIHNMDFEATFLLPRLYMRGLISRVFAKSEHAPLEIELKNGIIFRDTAALTNMSLASLAKNYTKTQKLKGDLDYTIPRNSETPLTDAEKQYCINDVVILKEYAEQLHNEYTMHKRKIPLTSTGIVRQYIKEQIPSNKRYIINRHIEKLFPESEQMYNSIMRWLFRGGYTHAQTGACGQILKNVVSYDLTSAYPSQMIHHYYPSSPFVEISDPDIDIVDKYINEGKAVIFTVEFTNIRATTPHSVESKHKLIDFEKAIFENGRLYKAARATVFITDVDFEIYKLFYTWDSVKVFRAWYAHKSRLPGYLYNSVLEFYKNKFELKNEVKALEKAIEEATDPKEIERLTELKNEKKKLLQKAKGMLNSTYGMTVSRLNFGMWVYGEHQNEDGENVVEWYEEEGKTYSELIRKQILSPYYGIYVTAYTRAAILKSIKNFGSFALYSDTDSIKILNTAPNISEYFAEYNNDIMDKNKVICERYGLDFNIYQDMGCYDCEGEYTRFKCLGAKRYLYEKNGQIEAVVAGLPKKATDDFVKRNGKNAIFRAFHDGMYFQYAEKNAHHYAGETTAIIEGETMHEYASCYIYETSFNLKIEPLFLTLMTERKEKFKDETKV